MKLEDIHFHDSQIIQVVEYPDVDDLVLQVDYPVDWDNNIFERRFIVFHDVLNYTVNEGPFSGAPTLLDVKNKGVVSGRQSIVLQTNAGTRSLEFSRVELTSENQGTTSG